MVAFRTAKKRNENLAIVNIDPLPGIVLNFGAVVDVLRDFFDLRRMGILEIQPCCLGQAYVRFERPLDREILIEEGPIPYANGHLTFARHNEGRNWRRVNFNTECWLMFLNFPADYQAKQFYQDAIGSFGKFILWQKEDRRVVRVIVKARVLDLHFVPHFIVFSKSKGMASNSWIV